MDHPTQGCTVKLSHTLSNNTRRKREMKRQKHVVLVVVALIATLIATGCQPCPCDVPMTTVLLMRHAEYEEDAALKRADILANVAENAGIKAIYTKDIERFQRTVRPLAQRLDLTPSTYQDIKEVVTAVQEDHYGEAVLIVGHSDTVPEIIDALGGDGTSCSIGSEEYDNLYIVTICRLDKVKVVKLQYGELSPTPTP